MKRFYLAAVTSVMLAGGTALQAQPPAYVPVGGQPVTVGRPLGASRDFFLSPGVRKAFPRLGTQIKVLGPETTDYNAFSYVLGITDRWLEPEGGTAAEPFRGIDRFLGPHGYRRLPTFDLRVRPGKQKVVVYATTKKDGDIEAITAATIQQPNGRWACKIGRRALIEVPHPKALRGPLYGLAVAVYERDVTVFPTRLGGR